MQLESSLNTNNISSSYPFLPYSSTLIMQCEKLLSVVLNRTAFLNTQQSAPPYIRALLDKKNLTLRLPSTVPECVIELNRLLNNTNDVNSLEDKKLEQTYGLNERSRSLIIFIFLIAFVSCLSIIGNLCLAKVLYSKRIRLSQTDRIVLCLALSELGLVLIDSPTEIYRFLSYSFSHTWLCRFHTFFESFFSSCIIFYHLLGAFDRFVYIHGHTSSHISTWSKWCRRISTKSGTIILLMLPILCSLPIAISNLLHAHVIHTTTNLTSCIVQYKHQILISFLISFYLLPLLFAFFLHGKLIFFIRSKHPRHYLATTSMSNSYTLSTKRTNTLDSQIIIQKTRHTPNQYIISRKNYPQLIQTKKINNKNQRVVTFNNMDNNQNTAGTMMTTSTTAMGQQILVNNSSYSTTSSRSSNSTSANSLTSPIILYKINSQANANAKRTVLLLVLLLSSYVLCWVPYNIYTWTQAYQLTSINIYRNDYLLNHTVIYDYNKTKITLTDNIHSELRRIIFVNYSLYLLSMISMCFSFIFYFALNKRARQEFRSTFGCICPSFLNSKESNNNHNLKQLYGKPKGLQYHTRYRHYNSQNNNQKNYDQRIKTIKYKTHATFVPPTPLLINQQHNRKHIGSSLPKRPGVTYNCHVQCCA